ncbi:hypothetical protein D3C79_980750 [compost metagenome]
MKDAIRAILAEGNLQNIFPDEQEREKYKADLIGFGRAIATSEYLNRDILSAIEQSLPPARPCKANPSLTSEGVQAMIASEHKTLGISLPEWS